MKELKATPGPWGLVVHTGDEKTIGPYSDWTVGAGDISICFEGGANPNAHADAHLIASAPDLYASLAEMVSMMDSGDEPGYGSDWYISASAALAKARGE